MVMVVRARWMKRESAPVSAFPRGSEGCTSSARRRHGGGQGCEVKSIESVAALAARSLPSNQAWVEGDVWMGVRWACGGRAAGVRWAC